MTDSTPLNFERTLLPWVGRVSKDFVYWAHRLFIMNHLDLTPHQWLVLKKLGEKDGQPQGDLAFITDRDKTSLTRLLQGMEKKGLIKRTHCKSDRRINHVWISQEGDKQLQRSMPMMKEMITEMQAGIEPEELHAAIKVLKKARENIELAQQEKQINYN